jgi:phosphotransferase system  glucose/maltose/N-acetylglucosamine-specific IIC component
MPQSLWTLAGLDNVGGVVSEVFASRTGIIGVIGVITFVVFALPATPSWIAWPCLGIAVIVQGRLIRRWTTTSSLILWRNVSKTY